MASKTRVAIIGTGGIAPAHADGLKGLSDRVEIVAAVDIDPTRLEDFCAKYQIANAYTDADSMLQKERPQLVHICTPPAFHCELSINAMKAGANVICEKPLCASLAE